VSGARAEEPAGPSATGGRKWSWLRAIGWIIAIGLIVAAVILIVEGARWRARFDEWIVAKPVAFNADLSKPGRFSAPFHQTCELAHAEVVGIECAKGAPVPKGAADGLKATITVENAAGQCLVRESVPDSWSSAMSGQVEDLEPLLRIESNLPNGGYTMTLVVQEGAPGLAGISTRVAARYELCGLEMLPAVFMERGGLACGLVGGLVGLPMAATAQWGRRRWSGAWRARRRWSTGGWG
jgi:hypothetical protein